MSEDRSYDLPLYTGSPPAAGGSSTSAEAAEALAPHAGRVRDQVLAALDAMPRTDDELEQVLDLPHTTVSARRRELVLLGEVIPSGETRPTRQGRRATVWRRTLEHERPEPGDVEQSARVIARRDREAEEGPQPGGLRIRAVLPHPRSVLMARALEMIAAERDRQDELVAAGKFGQTAAWPGMPNLLRLAVLGEEQGEVTEAVLEHDIHDNTAKGRARWRQNLRAELVQVAAVAVAWLEGLDREDIEREPGDEPGGSNDGKADEGEGPAEGPGPGLV